jgi:hydroxyacylglutathione hydrolase
VTGGDLHEALRAGSGPAILDVRSAGEFAAGHIEGADNLPFWRLLLSRPLMSAGADEPVVVSCGHGPRARVALAALRRRGYRRAEALDGHMAGWRRAGRPTCACASGSPRPGSCTSARRPGRCRRTRASVSPSTNSITR